MGALKDALRHPDELLPMAALYLSSQRVKRLPKNPDLAFCYDSLNRVSRSFAVVIAQLPPALRDGVCVFYLVLRALDTIEDDMSIPVAEKVPLLRSFHSHIGDESYSSSYGAGHYRVLMQRFGHVARVYATLEPEARDVIEEMCARMGAGMADFAETEVETVAQYDLYCHYVAGLVGMGLSRLFVHLGGEHPSLSAADELSNHMALFLQKTNIIRDYLEDITEEPRPRMFWPREVWGRFANELADFAEPRHRRQAVRCLNALVLDALRHVPFCLHYLSLLRDPAVFCFCAIPQVMAAGTLARCLNNPRVFEGVVKMRRGETAKVMHALRAEEDALLAFRG
ncbi:squalene/phytoene synthase, partial [Helicosporidium sp. ATCC 50920]